ncbi:Calcium-dependent lipid-binding family protein [Heracleum sosnowskyi]|uniref:Calcium-dependent lipid-binding family protein n=1 Tax=Heracleum sosnowskyi TaxID=360622 RepID=A0AAD8JIF1_9APIA|nr:Calcium-dependent lipid-binding family protein [Heracleum sosnowskyi]
MDVFDQTTQFLYNPHATKTPTIPSQLRSSMVVAKSPEFNESLIMKVTQLDARLKCEMWILSRVKNYMEDQLLGFALVPISSVAGKGKLTKDFSISSTDLFHSPAGTIKLSLSLETSLSGDHNSSDSMEKTSHPRLYLLKYTNQSITTEAQFSESLEKMKLPMDLNKQKAENHSNVIQNQNHNNNVEVEPKKEAARVFYGSRAFF